MIHEPWQALRELFRQWTGMVLPETMRPTALDLLQRMAARESQEPLSYLHLMSDDQHRRQSLLDQIGLGTTWFMRDEAGMRALVSTLAREMPKEQPVYLWSAGCSSGEEPYSMAMAMADHGRSVRILATDLNRLALKRAREGRFPARSIRRVPAAWREHYFDKEEGGVFRVKRDIRARVSFELHNVIVNESPPPGWSRFDAVVCRNVLIYFEREQAVAIIDRLSRACRPGGYLLLGAIERPLFWMSKLATREQAAELLQLSTVEPGARLLSYAQELPRRSQRSVRPLQIAAKGSRPTTAPPEYLLKVERLLARADQAEKDGLHDHALSLVDAAIAIAPLWPPAHLARGLVLKHAGRVHEAIDALRASRFLDGHAWLAPYQLALCLEAVGEPEDALEAYRHALGVLETQGQSGLHRPSAEVDSLAMTAIEVCRDRIGASESEE